MAKTAQEFANDIYQNLCATQNDLGRRIKAMQEEYDAIEKRIQGINDHVPYLHQLEEKIRREIADASKPAVKLDNITNLVDEPK